MEHLVLTKQSAKIDMSAGIWSDGWLVRIFEDTVKCQIRMFYQYSVFTKYIHP